MFNLLSTSNDQTFNSIYLLWAGILNLFMFTGILMFTCGLIRAKNTSAVLAKGIITFAVTALVYLGVGYQLMFLVASGANPYFPDFQLFATQHWSHFLKGHLRAIDIAHAYYQFTVITIVMAIIISATAEHLKLWAMILFSLLFVGLVYPIQGYWFKGGGFLYHLGFIDQAGAGTVYLTAGTAALAAITCLGARIDKYQQHKIMPILGCNMPLATLGVLFIIIGSLGFNSTYGVRSLVTIEQQVQVMAMIFLNTCTSVAASVFACAVMNKIIYGKVDLTLILNAALTGIVTIAAQPARATLTEVVIIASLGSILVTIAIILLDKIKVDDPVGAVAVYAVGGVWSLLTAAFSANPLEVLNGSTTTINLWQQLFIQLAGIVVIFIWVLLLSIIIFMLIKLIIGLRLSHVEEVEGLDRRDCGTSAYPEFIIYSSRVTTRAGDS